MATFEEKLACLQRLINERITQTIIKCQPTSLYQPIQYLLESGGKRIRPILLILSCQAVGGRLEDCLDAAVAVELLHNFTLVHDDIMDQDDTRRGRLTVHKKWDESVALLAGDGLVALAYKSLFNTKTKKVAAIAEKFTQGIIEVCEGQALDREFENRWDVTLDDYYTMIEKKTARLLALSAEIGAIIGGGTRLEINALHDFGQYVGKAFQIQDDLLDISSDEKVLGKTFASDIVQGKRTFLSIYAHQVATNQDKKTIENLLPRPALLHSEPRSGVKKMRTQPTIDREKILQIKAIFEKTGTLEEAQKVIRTNIEAAKKNLTKLKDTPARADLEQFLNLISKRKY